MNTNLLKYLLKTAETHSVTAAAEYLGISQSALSQQLKQLEKLYGTKLFERHKNGVSLTDSGKALVPYAQRVLGELDEAKVVIQELEELEQSHLTIGVVQTVNLNLMPSVIGQFRKKFPDVSLEIFEYVSDTIEPHLLANKFDLGIGLTDMSGFTWGDQTQFYTEPLYTEDMLVVVADSHPLWSRNEVSIQELHDLATVDVMPGNKRIWQEVCSQAGIKTKTVAEMTSISSAITTITYLQVATVIPAVSIIETKQKNIKGIPIIDFRPTRTIGCLWRKHQHRSQLSLELAKIIRESVMALNNPHIRAEKKLHS